MEIELTKDADYLIKVLYARYLDQRQYGKSKFDSAYFGGSDTIYNTFFAEWSIEDLDTVLIELNESGLVDILEADDSIAECSLTSKGIVYMEKRFGRKLQDILNLIGNIKGFIP